MRFLLDQDVYASASRDIVPQLIATAEWMCSMMDAVRERHEVRARVAINGVALQS